MLVENDEDIGEGKLTDSVGDFGDSGGSGISTEADIDEGDGNTIDSETGKGDSDSDGVLTEKGLARGCGGSIAENDIVDGELGRGDNGSIDDGVVQVSVSRIVRS